MDKRSLMFAIVTTLFCVPGIYAQKTVTVSQQVKDQVSTMLANAPSAIFSEKAPGLDKNFMKACSGQKSNISMPPVAACTYYGPDVVGASPDPNLKIEKYMALFKACALDGTLSNCSELIELLFRGGKEDYAFALIEEGEFPSQTWLFQDPSIDSNGHLHLGMPQQIFSGNPGYLLTDANDISQVLHSICYAEQVRVRSTGFGEVGASCVLANQHRAGVNEEQVAQGVNNFNAGQAQKYNAIQAAQERGEREAEARDQTANAIVGALNSANQGVAHPMPYPSQTQASSTYPATTAQSSTAGGQTASEQNAPAAGDSQCQWMTSSVSRTLHFNLDHAANYCTQGSRDIQWIYTNHSSTYVVCTVRAWSNGSISNGSMEIAPNAEAIGENSCARDGQSEYVCYPQVGATANCLNVNWTIN